MSRRMIGLMALAAVLMIGIMACDNNNEEEAASLVPAPTPAAQPNPDIEALKAQLEETNTAITAIELRIQDLQEEFDKNLGKVKSEVAKFKETNDSLKEKIGAPGVAKSISAAAAEPAMQAPTPPAAKAKGMSPTTRLILIVLIIAGALAIIVIVLRPKAVTDEDFDDFDDDFEDFEIDVEEDNTTEEDKKE